MARSGAQVGVATPASGRWDVDAFTRTMPRAEPDAPRRWPEHAGAVALAVIGQLALFMLIARPIAEPRDAGEPLLVEFIPVAAPSDGRVDAPRPAAADRVSAAAPTDVPQLPAPESSEAPTEPVPIVQADAGEAGLAEAGDAGFDRMARLLQIHRELQAAQTLRPGYAAGTRARTTAAPVPGETPPLLSIDVDPVFPGASTELRDAVIDAFARAGIDPARLPGDGCVLDLPNPQGRPTLEVAEACALSVAEQQRLSDAFADAAFAWPPAQLALHRGVASDAREAVQVAVP